MTRRYPTLLFYLLFASCVCAQNSSLVYPSLVEQYENYEDAYIAPGGRGFAIGSCNSLYLTTDDGATWSSRPLPRENVDLLAVQCEPGTNCSKVYLSHSRGVHRSDDGGENWTQVTVARMVQIDFSQSPRLHGFINRGRELYTSEDDGVSWVNTPLPGPLTDDIHFASGTDFAMLTDSSFYRTTDGGSTWQETFKFPTKTVLSTLDDDGNYYVETQTRGIYKSTDNGTSWTQKTENAHQYGVFYDLYKDAEDSLHVISFNGVHFASGDDGVNWETVRGYRFQRYNRFRRAEGRLFAAGSGLTILAGNADYSEMKPLVSQGFTEFREIVFHDSDTGYAFGEQGEVFRTTNGGDAWSLVSQIGDWMGSRPKVAADGSIYGVLGFTNFSRSTDQGETWDELPAANQAIGGGRRVFDALPNGEVVVMTNQKTVRLDANNNVVFAEDGGHPSTSGGTFDLKMIDANLGFIIRWARLEIYRTADSGVSWDTIPAFGGNNFFSWFDVEDANTFLIGNGSSSWRTTDAGQTWAAYSNFAALGRFTVGDDLYGFNRTALNRSRDGGENWEEKFRTCSQPIDMVRRPGTNEIFLAYQNGIERLDLDEILSPVRQPRPSAIALRAVPNPTGGMVTVSIPGNNASNGVADLFDLTGRRANAPIIQNGGELKVDLSGLKPGCYLLRYASATGELSQTRIIRH